MAFAPNPLSLSVPEPEFESWLRDSGFLEVLDQRTTDLHRLSSAAAAAAATPSSSAATSATATAASNGLFFFLFFSRLFSSVWTLVSLLTFNPFSKLTADDFSGETPTWTVSFLGSCESYSFPSSPAQARLRVHENVKRYARNYASLLVLFFACSLYQLPIALLGLISCLALWDMFKSSGDRWGLDRYPTTRQILVRLAQCVTYLGGIIFCFDKCGVNLPTAAIEHISKSLAIVVADFDKASLLAVTAVILFISNVQLAIVWACGVSYAVMILHASFRKLTPSKQPALKGGSKRTGRR